MRIVVLIMTAGIAGCRVGIETTPMPVTSRFVCDVHVGNDVARFLLDTGSPGTLIDAATARRLRLAPAPEAAALPHLVDSTGVRRAPEGAVLVDGLLLANVVYDPFTAFVVPEGAVGGADGILGLDVQSTAAWIFVQPSSPAGHALFTDPLRLESELRARGFRVEARLPIDLRDHRPFVKVLLDGVEVEMLLDTGASATSLSGAIVERLALPSGEELQRRQRVLTAQKMQSDLARQGLTDSVVEVRGSNTARGIFGAGQAQRPYHLSRLQLGTAVIDDLLVFAAEDRGSRAVSLLGADVLGALTWAVDWQRRELLLLAQ